MNRPTTLQRLAAGIGLLMAVFLLLGAGLGQGYPGVSSLEGTWTGEGQSIELPGLFAAQGLPADGRITVSRDIEVRTSDRQAVWVEQPQYGLGVRLDGEALRELPHEPEARSVLVLFPDLEVGTHELEFTIQGAMGEGGATGRIVTGPAQQVRQLAEHSAGLRVGLALGLGLLAFGHLAVGTLRRRPPAIVLFGSFLLALATWCLLTSDLPADWMSLVQQLRVRRISYAWVSGLGVAYVALFHGSRITKVEWTFVAGSAATSLLSAIAPSTWFYRLEQVEDASLVLAMGWTIVLTVRAVRMGRGGPALLFLGTLAPVVGVSVLEIGITHGLAGGSSQIFTGILAFVAASSVALALVHADEAERHRRLVAGTPDAMFFLREDGTVVDANGPARSMLGDGFNLLSAVVDEDRPLVRAHLARGLEKTDHCEFTLESGLPVESVATPLGTVCLLVVRDITQRKRADEWLLQAARVETVAALVGGVARDFRTTLDSLEEELEALRSGADEKAAERVDRMAATMERARLLTRRLLAVAGGTSSTLGGVRAGDVVRGAVELVEPTLPSGIRMGVELPEELPMVYGSSADLEHILVNLLFNARDAIGERGSIHLGAQAFSVDGCRGVVIFVDDNGPGVPEGLERSIFDPFFTTKKRGTGLGLAVSSQIIRDHLGRMWVEPVLGGGSRFLVALRLVADVEAAQPALPEGRCVLLVEDDEGMREGYVTALETAGYEVTPVSDGGEAMSRMAALRPDILVADLVAPEVNGVELARAFEARFPGLPVILVGGLVGAGDPEETWERYDKPLRPERLVAAVGRARLRTEQGEAEDALPSFDDLSSEAMGLL